MGPHSWEASGALEEGLEAHVGAQLGPSCALSGCSVASIESRGVVVARLWARRGSMEANKNRQKRTPQLTQQQNNKHTENHGFGGLRGSITNSVHLGQPICFLSFDNFDPNYKF